MKLILYFIVVCSFVMFQKTSAYFGDQRYTLLNPPTEAGISLINDSYTGGLQSYEFTSGDPVIVNPSDVNLLGEILSSPFIVTAIFKSYNGASSCPFAIMQETRIILSVCVEPSGEDQTRVTVNTPLYEPKKIIKYKFNQDFKNKWLKLLVYVKEDTAALYINCSKEHVFESLKKVDDIIVTKDMHIKLAHSFSAIYKFQGAIEEISLYTNANDDTENFICNRGRSIFDILQTTTPESLGDPETVPPPTTPEPILAEKGEKGEKGLKGEVGEAGVKGIKGEKGDKGDTGQKGDLGPKGPIGPIGPSAKKGEQGTCECSEKLVSSLLLKMPEMKGPPGERGPTGYDGKPGTSGETGKIGPQGERGPQGLKGETGARGDDGLRGKDGATGPKGEPGKDGLPGSIGEQGPKGEQGPPGPIREETEEEKKARIVKIPGEKGAAGPTGPPGSAGEKGVQGDMGPKGEVGPMGEKGVEGRMGLQGPRGEKGDTGEAGKDGLPGTPGTHGRPADKAEKGERGDKGVPGLAGLPASLTSVLDAENAAVVEKLRGFKGERGETGEKGDKGDKGSIGNEGPRGKDGKDGSPGSKGEVGPKGSLGHKGNRGEPGPAGQVPASEIALLKGAKGDRGQPGLRGEPGPTGSTGKTGEIGPVGPKGPKGDTGPSGPMGPMGLSGYNGTVGEKGQKGDSAPKINLNKLKGDKGDRGLPGDSGKPGDIGPQGPPGTCVETSTRAPVVGAPGPPGPPGRPGVSIMGQKGEPGDTMIQKMDDKINSLPDYSDDEDDFYSLRTVVVRTKRGLMKRTQEIRLGTLAYVLQEEILLLRVEYGWKYVVMSSLMDAMPAFTTQTPPISTTFSLPTSSSIKLHPVESPPNTRDPPPKTRGFIRMVALNKPYHGKFLSHKKTGREGADKLCYRQGKMFKLGGTFRAFLAASDQHLFFIVARGERNLPVVNLNGSLLFKSWKSIFNGSGAEFASEPANIYSFNGKSVMIDPNWPNKTVWHGGNNDRNGTANQAGNCNDWKSGSEYYKGVGSSLETNRLLNQEFYNCDNNFIVLCVEVAAYRGDIPLRRKRHHQRPSLLLN